MKCCFFKTKGRAARTYLKSSLKISRISTCDATGDTKKSNKEVVYQRPISKTNAHKAKNFIHQANHQHFFYFIKSPYALSFLQFNQKKKKKVQCLFFSV